MAREEWGETIERMAETEERAASAQGVECAEFDRDLVSIEDEVVQICHGMEVGSDSQAIVALKATRDIATLEALAVLRSQAMIELLEKVISWLSRGRCA